MFRVAAAYLVTGWLLIEVASVLLPTFEAPAWVLKVFSALVLLGFPIALVFAWAFELTPEGLKREADVDRSQSITPVTGRRLDRIVIGLLAIAVVYFIVERNFEAPGPTQTQAPILTPPATQTPTAAPEESDGKSIAVLPFANLSGDPGNESFVAGLHDDLLTQLSKIHDLKVISRTSVLSYAGTTRKIGDIGQELGVSTVMEGGVQRAGDRVRINVQLIDADSDEHIWAETYDRQMTVDNIFDIQSEITRQIASQLQAAMTEGESSGLESRPTDNLAAYEAYLDAKILLDRSGGGELALFEDSRLSALKAVTLDPDFADAWALLGLATLYQFWYEGRDPTKAEAANEAIQRSLTLDPGSAAAHIANGWYLYWVFFDYSAAIPEFEHGLDLQPGSSMAWDGLASVYRRTGRWSEAVSAFNKAVELAPNDTSEYMELVSTLVMMRDFDRADGVLEEAARRFPDSEVIAINLSRLEFHRTGDPRDLISDLKKLASGEFPHPASRYMYVLFEGLYGDPEAAIEYLRRWSPGIVDVQNAYAPQSLLEALIRAMAGDVATATPLASDALATIETAARAEPDNAEIEKARGYALALLGRTDAAVASARRMRELYPPSLDAFAGLEYLMESAAIASIAGATDQGLEWLREYESFGKGTTLAVIRVDPRFRNLVADPRFREITTQDTAGAPQAR